MKLMKEVGKKTVIGYDYDEQEEYEYVVPVLKPTLYGRWVRIKNEFLYRTHLRKRPDFNDILKKVYMKNIEANVFGENVLLKRLREKNENQS